MPDDRTQTALPNATQNISDNKTLTRPDDGILLGQMIEHRMDQMTEDKTEQMTEHRTNRADDGTQNGPDDGTLTDV